MHRKPWWSLSVMGLLVLIGIGSTFALSGCSSDSSVKGDGEFIKIGNKGLAKISKNKETKFVYGYSMNDEDRKPFEKRMKTVMKDMGVNIYRYKPIPWGRDHGTIVDKNGKKITGDKLKAIKIAPYVDEIFFFHNGKKVGELDFSDYENSNDGYQKFQKDFKAFLKDMIKNYTE